MNGVPILTILTAVPLLGALLCLLTSRFARDIALLAALLSLGVALAVWFQTPASGQLGMLELHRGWIPALGAEYHLGADGLSALMVVLTALVTLMSIDAAQRVHHQPGLYFALALLLEAGLFGSFTALNFIHWFFFWELCLLPAFFLIKLWGGARRGPAATQFFLYTMAGSASLLVCFLGLFLATGSMDFSHLAQMASSGELEQAVAARFGASAPLWLAVGVLAGFAVKAPLAPFHTWLPEAYAQAPSPVTMLLTGAMSKMGVYGLLRIALPLFGAQIAVMRTPLLALAVLTVALGSWAAFAQRDMKKIFAYFSVCHVGYCLLGIFALATPAADALRHADQTAALNGVLLQMFNHGVTAASLFWFVSMLQLRTGGSRSVEEFGGLRRPAPVLVGTMGVALFSSLGLPGLNGFTGEYLIFRGVFPLAWPAAAIALLGLLATAATTLLLIQKVFWGPTPERWLGFPDLHGGERMAVTPVIALMLVVGLAPQLIVATIAPTAANLLAHWRF